MAVNNGFCLKIWGKQELVTETALESQQGITKRLMELLREKQPSPAEQQLIRAGSNLIGTEEHLTM